MSRRKIDHPKTGQLPAPQRGGSYIRKPDGTLSAADDPRKEPAAFKAPAEAADQEEG